MSQEPRRDTSVGVVSTWMAWKGAAGQTWERREPGEEP